MTLSTRISLLGTAILVPALHAQVVNPADKQRPPADSTQAPEQVRPVVVQGERVSNLREEDRVGSYAQPIWSTRRLFTETRLYVRPEGQCEFEYWLQPEIDDTGHTSTRTQYEFEFGLPNRMQLDLYLVSHQDGNDGSAEFDERKFELRYALADWDEIWGNPTAYVEWASKDDAPDGVEFKLLFGGEACEGWHWGTNLVFETETGGVREHKYEVTAGVSHTVVDEKFSAGLEAVASMADDATDRGNFTDEVLVGPTMQYRMMPHAHIDLAVIAGLTKDSPDAKATLVFGWEF
ncbi:MAG: hypothetical protein KDB80_11045 [Planctomycetes bacterium]|nr:hypothetical protein [Planctomycetota bacterium]